ncbi:MAG: hypothetical protein ABFC63_11310 [Thermoguttaceae bacterium]
MPGTVPAIIYASISGAENPGYWWCEESGINYAAWFNNYTWYLAPDGECYWSEVAHIGGDVYARMAMSIENGWLAHRGLAIGYMDNGQFKAAEYVEGHSLTLETADCSTINGYIPVDDGFDCVDFPVETCLLHVWV